MRRSKSDKPGLPIKSTSGQLPTVTAEQTKATYIGNTVKYKDNGDVYYTWMADGTLLGIYDKEDGTHTWADGHVNREGQHLLL